MSDSKIVYFRGQPVVKVKSSSPPPPPPPPPNAKSGAYYTFADENKAGDGDDSLDEEEREEMRLELLEKQRRKKFKAALVHDLQDLQTAITSHGRFTDQSQELLLNIHRYFKAEKETKTFLLPTDSVLERCSMATGLSLEMLTKFLFEKPSSTTTTTETKNKNVDDDSEKTDEKIGDENVQSGGENEPEAKKAKIDREEKSAEECQ
uniref:Uncharacterized protein n=1 Tax=Romanomermis culicivorax TaxID=13658 RepID=A0A915HP89_ROMCU